MHRINNISSLHLWRWSGLLSVTLSVALVGTVNAAAGDLTYSADTTVALTSPNSYNLTILSGSTAESLVINAGTVVVTMGAGDVFTITSASTDLSISGSNANITAINNCSAAQLATITITSTTGTGSYTLTPTAELCGITPTASSGGGSGGGGGGGSGTGTYTPPTTDSGTTPTVPSNTSSSTPASSAVTGDANQLTQQLGVARDTTAETTNGAKVSLSATEFKVTLDATSKTIATNFVTYGISTATMNLGSGERLALIRDQLETLGRISLTALEELANGQKPTDRNLPKEVAQAGKVLNYFKLLTGHNPNFKDAKEDLAWNTMMYRVRFDRDLVKEKAGIVKFKATFARTPKTPLEWATVRAYGYSLK